MIGSNPTSVKAPKAQVMSGKKRETTGVVFMGNIWFEKTNSR